MAEDELKERLRRFMVFAAIHSITLERNSARDQARLEASQFAQILLAMK